MDVLMFPLEQIPYSIQDGKYGKSYALTDAVSQNTLFSGFSS